MKKIVLLHFLPLEQYPPAMNIIDYLVSHLDAEIIVLTTSPQKHLQLTRYENANQKVKIIRTSSIDSQSKWRYLNYLKYYIVCFFTLLFKRPKAIFYIETLSSFSALLYKKWINRKVDLLAHYHEYNTSLEYANNMLLVKWFHNMELGSYPKFKWISQTNTERLSRFRADINMNDARYNTVFHEMPNYPPPTWISKPKSELTFPVKLVYVGSLGLDTMYLKELLEWIDKKEGQYTLDIFAYNISQDATKYLGRWENSANVNFHGGCNYYELPKILPNYDVGIVMYKPFSLNTIHAVSNKIMEYMSLGLDVWFSKEMEHSFKYVREDCYPKVLPLDFNALDDFNFEKALNRSGLSYVPSPHNYDDIYIHLKNHLTAGLVNHGSAFHE
jgi:hypothetical protein